MCPVNVKRYMHFLPSLAILAAASGPLLLAQPSGVIGYWKEPEGSVIQIDTCGREICATLVAISPSAPARVDGKNPDAKLRQRSLCGLRIGEGFHLASPVKAEGGTIYDPKSGKTYRGVMAAHGEELDLRGFVGLSVFGRTERWTRALPVATCSR